MAAVTPQHIKNNNMEATGTKADDWEAGWEPLPGRF